MVLEMATRPQWDAAARRVPAVVALAAVAVLAVGVSPLLAGPLAVAVGTVDLVRIDVAELRLPNRIVLPCYPVAVAGIAAGGILTGEPSAAALVSCASWLVFFLVLHLTGGMGMGDVKLAGLLGLCLGSIGAVWSIVGILLAFLFGGIGALIVLARRVGGRNSRIPFGPFLLAGFWVTLALSPLLAAPTP
ncbi:leader peptidase (prepilin peptidase)/N-methyltransferase [Mycetocola sp. CAN_C7]|uniref:prepilin peptidase n=1 Tax=Mycetocola sp. CAN_C7 TaxID=2787724 RepID=UPI0018C9BC80